MSEMEQYRGGSAPVSRSVLSSTGRQARAIERAAFGRALQRQADHADALQTVVDKAREADTRLDASAYLVGRYLEHDVALARFRDMVVDQEGESLTSIDTAEATAFARSLLAKAVAAGNEQILRAGHH